MKEIWEDRGRWHAKYKTNYAIVATEEEAKAKVLQWKGLAAPVASEEKIVGAIVEESILDADLDDDGIIEKAELKEWLSKSEDA